MDFHLSGFSGASFPAANRTPHRSDLSLVVPKNQRQDLPPHTRETLVSISRALCRHLGLYNRIKLVTSRYSVGRGLMPTPKTSNADWNEAAQKYFTNWAMDPIRCDKHGLRNFVQMQKQVVSETVGDGERIHVKQGQPFYRDGSILTRTPQLMGVDPLLLRNPQGIHNPAKQGIHDGVEVNPRKRPRAYHIADPDSDTGTTRIPARHILHTFSTYHCINYRGHPWWHAGMNNGTDTLDLLALEKHSAKLHSVLAAVIQRHEDKLNPLAKQANQQQGIGGTDPTDSGCNDNCPSDESEWKNLQQFLNFDGAKLFDDPSIKDILLKSPERPNLDLVEFLKALRKDICWSMGFTDEFLFDISNATGANTRFVLADAQQLFQDCQDMLITRFCQPTYVYVIATAMQNYIDTDGLIGLPPSPDPEWWVAEWSRPPLVTVDIGRDGALFLKLIKAGMMSLDRWYKMQGLDPEHESETHVLAVKRFLDLCKEHNVPYELINEALLGKTLSEELAQQLADLLDRESPPTDDD